MLISWWLLWRSTQISCCFSKVSLVGLDLDLDGFADFDSILVWFLALLADCRFGTEEVLLFSERSGQKIASGTNMARTYWQKKSIGRLKF